MTQIFLSRMMHSLMNWIVCLAVREYSNRTRREEGRYEGFHDAGAQCSVSHTSINLNQLETNWLPAGHDWIDICVGCRKLPANWYESTTVVIDPIFWLKRLFLFLFARSSCPLLMNGNGRQVNGDRFVDGWCWSVWMKDHYGCGDELWSVGEWTLMACLFLFWLERQVRRHPGVRCESRARCSRDGRLVGRQNLPGGHYLSLVRQFYGLP